jgi:Fic family protein
MILNSYRTMRTLDQLKLTPLDPLIIMKLHQITTEGTLADPTGCGRLRRKEDAIAIYDDQGHLLYEPPAAEELPDRMVRLCSFANSGNEDDFIHPVLRSIILHFWLAYDHPFIDGNGRTSRAVFYWSMLRHGYWLCEFLSISSILRRAPAKYIRSFLYTETDDNDLTYFIDFQIRVIRGAIEDLYQHVHRKSTEHRKLEQQLRGMRVLNYRQKALMAHALKHPDQEYTFRSHQSSHDVVYETARRDLLDLATRGLLQVHKRGKSFVFSPAGNLSERLSSGLERTEDGTDRQ